MAVRTRPQRKAFRLSGETLMGLRRFRSRQTDHGRHTGTGSVVGGASEVAALGASTHRAIPGATRAGGSRRSRRVGIFGTLTLPFGISVLQYALGGLVISSIVIVAAIG